MYSAVVRETKLCVSTSYLSKILFIGVLYFCIFFNSTTGNPLFMDSHGDQKNIIRAKTVMRFPNMYCSTIQFHLMKHLQSEQ